MLPHLTTEDTVYDGYLIPKGSMLLAHIKYENLFMIGPYHLTHFLPRSMLRDERFWDDPSEFKPERFMGELREGQVDPVSLIFGFGRRLAIRLLRLMHFSADSKE